MAKMINTPAPVLARLWRRTTIDPVTGCWVWGGYCMKGGYGRITYGAPGKLIHRVSWAIHNGDIPDGMDVLHRCDNPPCWNPEHFFLGDDAANVADKMAKGRHRCGAPRRGADNWWAILDEATVLKIREAASTSGQPQTAIGKQFGVSQSLISQIINRRIWTHI